MTPYCVHVYPSAVSVIGFARDMVTVNETDGSAVLTVRVLMGVLAPGATAVVEFSTANRPVSDTSAIGESAALYTFIPYFNVSDQSDCSIASA